MSLCQGSFYERSNTFTNKACECAEKSANAAIQSKQIYDKFKSIYLGAFPSDPTPPFGENFQVGALYFNSTVDAMYVYDGTGWIFASPTTLSVGPSASDVLSIFTNTIAAVSPGGDKVVFYDQSAGKLTYLNIGPFLSLTGTTLDAIPTTVNSSAADVLSAINNEIFADAAASDKLVFYDLSSNKLTYLDVGPYLSITGTTINSAPPSVNATAADILTVTGNEIFADNAGADRIVFWDDSAGKLAYLEAGAGLALSGTTLTAIGTINGGTGSTDNAIIRADGTGGITVQASDLNIDDAATGAFGNNVAITNQHSGQTNSALVLTPKGTGAFIAGPKPDGTPTGGNARGANAVDIQSARNNAVQIASGARSVAIGSFSTAGGIESVAIGYAATASATGTVSIGAQNTASNNYSCAIGGQSNQAIGSDWSFVGGGTGNTSSNNCSFVGAGNANTASGEFSFVAAGQGNSSSTSMTFSCGQQAVANRYAIMAQASGRFAANGDAQRIHAVLRNKTTTNSAVELFLNGSTSRLTLQSGKVMAMMINITGIKSDGSAVAHYVRKYAIKNVIGTTSEVYSAQTIGTDVAAGTTIALSANDTNDALKIDVTGIASETWRWVASVDAVEANYGT